jgi:membrane protease subunit (stomatin/prohibitin family)
MAIIDMVSWDIELDRSISGPVFAWKYPGSNLSTFTQLVVRESQEAVLFSKGKLLGKFGPGKHTLNTENLPLLRRLYGLPFGTKNPFFAEVWFVNKLVPLNIDWTTSSMLYQDPDYQAMVPLMACGRYGLKVQDAERFLIKLVGTALDFKAKSLTDHFQGALEAKTKTTILSYMQSQRIGIKSISAYLEPLSVALRDSMLAFWEDYGFHLEGFYITSIQVDERDPAGPRILEAISRQSAQAIGGYSWQQSKAFEVADHAVASAFNKNSGMLGALAVAGMMGGGGGGVGGALLQPNPAGVSVTGASGQAGSGTQLPPREVFCSNCAKKYSNASKFCPHCGDPYMPCPRCGADNDKEARRCVSCGTPLVAAQTCSHCGAPLPPNANACPRCARPPGVAQACKRCGVPLAAGDTFCPECGQKAE